MPAFARLAPIALLTAAALAQTAAAQGAACYALAATADGSDALGDLTLTGAGDITFTYAGYDHMPFEDDCDLAGDDSTTCATDCDGGRVTLVRMGEDVLVNYGRRIESVRFESVITAAGSLDASGEGLEGTYRLSPAPLATCTELASRSADVPLGPGAHFPGVARLETGLAQAGYFAGVPDWTFTPETSDALRAAQSDLGQPVTGVATRAFLRLLDRQSGQLGGGC